jgi:hypothetical protein
MKARIEWRTLVAAIVVHDPHPCLWGSMVAEWHVIVPRYMYYIDFTIYHM